MHAQTSKDKKQSMHARLLNFTRPSLLMKATLCGGNVGEHMNESPVYTCVI